MTLRAQAARGLKWQAIEISGRQVLSLVVFTTLARLLDPTAFGLVGMVVVYLAFVQILAEQGIGAALVQRKDLQPQHLDAAFWFNVACAAGLCTVTIAVAEPVATLFDEPRLTPLLRWASPALVINALGAIHAAVFVRAMDFRRPAIRTFVANFFGGTVGIVMALAGCGVWALIAQQLAASVAGVVFLWAASSWRPSLGFSVPHLRQLLAISSSVFATGLMAFVSGRTDYLIIGKFLGTVPLGFYTVANRLGDLARASLYQPLGGVALPALSRVQHDKPRLHAAINRGMEVNALVSFPSLLGLSAIATNLVPLMLGSQWQPAGEVLQLLALYVLLHGLWCIIHYALLATGNAGATLLVNVARTVGIVVACGVGVQFGLRAVVAGLVVVDLLMIVPRLYLLWTRTGFAPRQYFRPCLEPAVASGLMYLAVVGIGKIVSLQDWPLLQLAIQIFAGIGVFLFVMSVLAPQHIRLLCDLTGLAIARQGALEDVPKPVATG